MTCNIQYNNFIYAFLYHEPQMKYRKNGDSYSVAQPSHGSYPFKNCPHP